MKRDLTALLLAAVTAVFSFGTLSGGAAAQTRSTAAAPTTGDPRLADFIRQPGHLNAVRAAITAFEPTVLAAACKDLRVVRGDTWKQLDAPNFETGANAPSRGAWEETWQVL